MSNQHTPGPWTHLDGGHETAAVFAGDDRERVALVDPVRGGLSAARANARLIAAAPELLAALRLMVDAATIDRIGPEDMVAAYEAIAKAVQS